MGAERQVSLKQDEGGLGLLPPSSQSRGSAHSVCPLPTTCKHTFGLLDGEMASREGWGWVRERGKGKKEDRKLLCWERGGKGMKKWLRFLYFFFISCPQCSLSYGFCLEKPRGQETATPHQPAWCCPSPFSWLLTDPTNKPLTL